jgi:hypothetical protein
MANQRARRTATAALLAIALVGAGPAAATTDTLARGAMDLVGTPLDLALVPYTMSASFVRKFYLGSNQSALQKAALTLPMAVVYGINCTAITLTTTFMRAVDGLLNVPIGLAVLGRDENPDTALYEPIHGSPGALVDYHGIYFGGYYCEGFFS